jgi:hypothetical protein
MYRTTLQRIKSIFYGAKASEKGRYYGNEHEKNLNNSKDHEHSSLTLKMLIARMGFHSFPSPE